MEAQSEHAHIACTFCTFGADLHAQWALINKISALELSREFTKGSTVGWAGIRKYVVVQYLQQREEMRARQKLMPCLSWITTTATTTKKNFNFAFP